jgi:hypothetical protein
VYISAFNLLTGGQKSRQHLVLVSARMTALTGRLVFHLAYVKVFHIFLIRNVLGHYLIIVFIADTM